MGVISVTIQPKPGKVGVTIVMDFTSLIGASEAITSGGHDSDDTMSVVRIDGHVVSHAELRRRAPVTRTDFHRQG